MLAIEFPRANTPWNFAQHLLSHFLFEPRSLRISAYRIRI